MTKKTGHKKTQRTWENTIKCLIKLRKKYNKMTQKAKG